MMDWTAILDHNAAAPWTFLEGSFWAFLLVVLAVDAVMHRERQPDHAPRLAAGGEPPVLLEDFGLVLFDPPLLNRQRLPHRPPHRRGQAPGHQGPLAGTEHLLEPHGAVLLQIHLLPDGILELGDRVVHHPAPLACDGGQ